MMSAIVVGRPGGILYSHLSHAALVVVGIKWPCDPEQLLKAGRRRNPRLLSSFSGNRCESSVRNVATGRGKTIFACRYFCASVTALVTEYMNFLIGLMKYACGIATA
jgi:hypothetical protein